ncbi:MAG: globin family protein [Pleurocapsa sp. MO_226.B13]|nr:globin family protein [Pleurocapsa sp. MO_226.B13]
MTLDIQLLSTSFDKIRDRAVEFSASFYTRLFDYHPELKPLFKNVDLVAQEKKLIASLAIIVENLRNPEQLTLALKSLGAYHHEVGTIEEHYLYVGQALLETFAQYLGSEWNQKTQQAWLDAYNLIAETMLEGAKKPEAYLGGELTFYEWLDLYGESSPTVKKAIANNTHFEYRNYKT